MDLLLWILGAAGMFAGLLGIATTSAWAWNARKCSARARPGILKTHPANSLPIATGVTGEDGPPSMSMRPRPRYRVFPGRR